MSIPSETISMLPLFVAAAGAGWLAYSYHKRRYRPTEPTFSGSSQKLAKTAFLTDLSESIPLGKSALWCINLELGWVKLRQEIFSGGPIGRDHPLATRLNSSNAAWQGPSEHFQVSLKQERPARNTLKIDLESNLMVKLPFTIPFFDNPEPLEFQGVPVRCFGIGSRDAPGQNFLRDQVSILYRGEGTREFVVDPCVTSVLFRFLLARVDRGESLEATIGRVRALCAESKPFRLGSNSTLLVPTQCWDIHHRHAELSGSITPPVDAERAELEACQRLQFRLDRSGAELMSQLKLGLMIFLKGAPTHYHFDRPYLMLLENRATGQTVMAAWIENTELLVPF